MPLLWLSLAFVLGLLAASAWQPLLLKRAGWGALMATAAGAG